MAHRDCKKTSVHSKCQNSVYKVNDTTYIVESHFSDKVGDKETLKEKLIHYLNSEFAYSTIFNGNDIISIDENDTYREGGI